jgi:hypothetical protein
MSVIDFLKSLAVLGETVKVSLYWFWPDKTLDDEYSVECDSLDEFLEYFSTSYHVLDDLTLYDLSNIAIVPHSKYLISVSITYRAEVSSSD